MAFSTTYMLVRWKTLLASNRRTFHLEQSGLSYQSLKISYSKLSYIASKFIPVATYNICICTVHWLVTMLVLRPNTF